MLYFSISPHRAEITPAIGLYATEIGHVGRRYYTFPRYVISGIGLSDSPNRILIYIKILLSYKILPCLSNILIVNIPATELFFIIRSSTLS